MDDLISRQELINRISEIIGRKSEQYPDAAFDAGMECAQSVAKELPSAVRRGRWIRTGADGYCSVCKCDMPMFRNDWEWKYTETRYCPNCGARMKK